MTSMEMKMIPSKEIGKVTCQHIKGAFGQSKELGPKIAQRPVRELSRRR